jgi:hypothetical protein
MISRKNITALLDQATTVAAIVNCGPSGLSGCKTEGALVPASDMALGSVAVDDIPIDLTPKVEVSDGIRVVQPT